MDIFLQDYGYPALFLLSFLASTLVPLGSEGMLVFMLLEGHSLWPVVAVATLGNTLGACTSYAIGWWGNAYVIRRWLHIDQTSLGRAERIYERFGALSLLFSWVPIIGDPLCLLGGMFQMKFFRFFMLVLTGKAIRYLAVAYGTIGAERWLT